LSEDNKKKGGNLMSDNQEGALKEIYVQLFANVFYVPRAILNHYSIKPGDGLICVLKEISDHTRRNVKKIDKEILVDIDPTDPMDRRDSIGGKAVISSGDIHLRDSQFNGGPLYALLLIKEVIHPKE